MTFDSSNKEWVESLSTNQVIEHIRLAMSEGCIKPSHVYDLVDEALQRLGATCTKMKVSEVRAEANDHCTPICPRCQQKKEGCDYLDSDGKTCRGIVYPTFPPQYAPCVFNKD